MKENDNFLKKCPFCNGKLNPLGIKLTEKEEDDIIYADNIISTAQTAMSPEVINKLKLTEDEMWIYFNSAFDQLAKGNFLRWVFEKNFKREHNLNIDLNLFIYNGEAFEHEHQK